MRFITAVTVAAALAVAPAFAQAPSAPSPAAEASPAAAQDYAEGEVRRVDKDTQKVTLRHGPIPNLGMGNMTMVFRVTDPAMLEAVKQGDKVRFRADKVGGQYTVTEMHVSP